MKKLFFFLALVPFLMTGCNDDNITKADPNQIIYDGIVVDVVPYMGFDVENSRFYMSANAMDTLHPATIKGDMFESNIGKLYDLTEQDMKDNFSLMFSMMNPDVYVGMENHPDDFRGVINETEYVNESPFNKGEMSLTREGDGYKFLLSGTLRNGKKLDVNLDITAEYVEILEWK